MSCVRRVRQLLAVAACAAAAAAACGAQQAPASSAGDEAVATLRVTTRTVEIATVVHDKVGDPQTGLTADAFTLKVDGREQPIQHFAVASDLPLTLALLVDVSGSQRTFIADEWRASDIFFQTMLTRPQDRATLIQVDARVHTLGTLTNSAERLHLALTQLGENPSTANGTLLNDAVYLSVKQLLSRERGRKAIVLLTDGGDNGSRYKLEQAIEEAQRGNVSVYAVEYSAWSDLSELAPVRTAPQRDPGAALLKKVAESTGGHVYTVTRSTPLRQIYQQIASDLHTAYELGYNPPAEMKPNSFHKLEVRMKDRKLVAQARTGFYIQP